MNKRKFFSLLGSAVVGALLSVGLKPIRETIEAPDEPDLTEQWMLTVQWYIADAYGSRMEITQYDGSWQLVRKERIPNAKSEE